MPFELVALSFVSTVWLKRELCAHVFIPHGHDFSENIFENGKMSHDYDPQQFLEIVRACIKS